MTAQLAFMKNSRSPNNQGTIWLTEAEWLEQQQSNHRELNHFMAQLEDTISEGPE
jgi:hypothetical protein